MTTYTIDQFVQADCALDNVNTAREVFVSWIAANAAELLPLLPTGSGRLAAGPYKDTTDAMLASYRSAGRSTAGAKAAHRRAMNVVRIIGANPRHTVEEDLAFSLRVINARIIANTDDADQIAAAIAGKRTTASRAPRNAAEKAAAEKAAAEKAAKAAEKAAEKAVKDAEKAAEKAAKDAEKAAKDAAEKAAKEEALALANLDGSARVERAHNALAAALTEYMDALANVREEEGGNLTAAAAAWMTAHLAKASALIAAA